MDHRPFTISGRLQQIIKSMVHPYWVEKWPSDHCISIFGEQMTTRWKEQVSMTFSNWHVSITSHLGACRMPGPISFYWLIDFIFIIGGSYPCAKNTTQLIIGYRTDLGKQDASGWYWSHTSDEEAAHSSTSQGNLGTSLGFDLQKHNGNYYHFNLSFLYSSLSSLCFFFLSTFLPCLLWINTKDPC